MALKRTDAQWETIEQAVQTEEEGMVVECARGGMVLNDVGWRVFRRVEARTPGMRAKLKAYNRVSTARKRRVDKGHWPVDIFTAQEAVAAGILDKADAYNTKLYTAAVDGWLAEKKLLVPLRKKAERAYVKPTTINVTVIGEIAGIATKLADGKTAEPSVSSGKTENGFTAEMVREEDGRFTAYVKPTEHPVLKLGKTTDERLMELATHIRLLQGNLDALLKEVALARAGL